MSRLYPAVDLLDGDVVMLRKGAFGDKTVYALSPVAYAEAVRKAGVSALHMVDLNGAETGELKNRAIIEKVAKVPGLFLQVGGGIRDESRIKAYLDAGVDRVILGTVAVTAPVFLEEMILRYGDQIAVGADCRDGRIVIRGWAEETMLTVETFLDRMEAVGVQTVIVTDVSRDGMLAGAHVDLYQRLRSHFSGELIASGGVSSYEDLKQLKGVSVDGAIVGSALLEGRITLMQAKHVMEGPMRKVIPCMDIKDGKVVKGVQFEHVKEVADPVELARQYEEDGADVLVFYDITASLEGRTLFQELFAKVRKAVNLPMVAGGGIQTLEDAKAIIDLGADCLSINSGALRQPAFIAEVAKAFGSDKVMLGVDVKSVGDTYHVFSHGGQKDTGKEAIAWISQCVEAGAGSVVVNAIHTDGMKQGYDLELMRRVTEAVDVPVIASGGAGDYAHFISLFQEVPKVDAALAASVFHFGEVCIPELRVRLDRAFAAENRKGGGLW